MSLKRAIMRIQLEPSAKAELEKICARRGMTQIALMSRLVHWFVKQDDIVQTSVLAALSDAALSGVARALLKKIAAAEGGDSR